MKISIYYNDYKNRAEPDNKKPPKHLINIVKKQFTLGVNN